MKTYKIDGQTIKVPTSTKEVKRHLLSLNIDGNLVKWLGRYDIAVPEQTGRLIPTGLKSVQDLSLDEWVILFNKAKQGYTYLG